MIKAWTLVLYLAGGYPPQALIVDNLASEEACRTLGVSMVADAKMANGANRYLFRCYPVEKASGQ